MNHIVKMIMVAAIALSLSPTVAWADNPNNVCRPDSNSENTDTVVCSWPSDPDSNASPDITDCQELLRIPDNSADDCGNEEFMHCMQDKGFECAHNGE